MYLNTYIFIIFIILMTKIAFCYFGMTRSTKFVYESHKQKLYDILKNNNIDYQIYMHTWETEKILYGKIHVKFQMTIMNINY